MTGATRRVAAGAAVVVCGLALATAATGGRQASAPPPALSSLALAVDDFQPGAKVNLERSERLGGQPVFVRRFSAGVRVSAQPLLSAVSEVILYDGAASAANDFVFLDSQLHTVAGRRAFAKALSGQIATGAKVKVKVKVSGVTVGVPAGLGTHELRVPIVIATNRGRLTIAFDLMQVDRVIGYVFLTGLLGERVSTADAVRAAASAKARLVAGFTVASTAPPTISGTAAQGQALTVDEGTWTGAPSSFGYSWARCDPAGVTCTPIAGATARTYVPGPADSGSTLRVTVTGTNSVGSQQADSAVTPVVT